MEFVGYVVKINKCYFRSKITGDYMICKAFEDAMKITSIRYARQIAGEIGGVVKQVYIDGGSKDEDTK